MEHQLKMVSQSETANVIVHHGVFHADDAMAVAIVLKTCGLVSVYRGVPTVEKLQDGGCCIIDIGNQYDPEIANFDHHQGGLYRLNRDGTQGIPYAACGLVWENYGSILYEPDIVNYVDNTLIKAIDAADNGLFPKEDFPVCTISGIIHNMNRVGGNQDKAFKDAVSLCYKILNDTIRAAEEFIEGRNTVLYDVKEMDAGRVLMFNKYPKGWQTHIKKHPLYETVQHIIYPAERGDGFMVAPVTEVIETPIGPEKITRSPFPERIHGLRDKELKEACDLTEGGDNTFIHASGFIGGSANIMDALKLTCIK